MFSLAQGGEADKGNVMCPGGQAEDGMGRVFSDVCCSLHADRFVHFVIKVSNLSFLSGDNVLWCFVLGQFKKQYPLMCHLMQTLQGRRWSINDLPKIFA